MTGDKSAFGRGMVLATIHRMNEPKVREVLGIPETVQTAVLILVGWSKGNFGAGLRKPVIGTRWPRNWRVSTCVAADCEQSGIVRGHRPVIPRDVVGPYECAMTDKVVASSAPLPEVLSS